MVKEKVKEKIQLVWNDTCNDLEDRFTCVCRIVRVGACATSASSPSSILITISIALRLPFSLFLLCFHKSGNCFKDILRGICRVASSNCLHCANI